MRNLKRALSLTLASVMLLGMMAIGTSAASYPDVDENDNVEAIEVLQTVGVMQGDDKGNFDPDRSVSRNEMAIIMAKLLNLDYNYYSESCPFWDVPDYAKPYVGACYANGIVSGYNANTYGGADTVTAVQAASMMMRALGYFQYDSDYKDGFVIATVRQASKIGLFADINAGQDTPLTRNQVAQLALNTLETAIVDAKDNTLNISGESGGMSMSVSGGQVDYIVRTSTEKFAAAINSSDTGDTTTTGRKGWTVELGEQLYNGDLKKDEYGTYYDENNVRYHNDITDDFGRPAVRWTYKFSEIGTYAETADYTYTKGASGDTPADKVRNMGLKGYKWDGVYTENGKETSIKDSNGDPLADAAALEKLADGITANGVLVEVYMDDDRTDTIEAVSVTRTQMMQVNVVGSSEVSLKKLDDDKREAEDGDDTKIAMGMNATGFYTVKNVKEDEDGYEVLKSLKADDYVLIVPVWNDKEYVVSEAIVPETLTGTLETIYTKSSNTKVAGIGVDGTRYDMSYTWTAEEDELKTNTKLSSKVECLVYLDTYGYAIYVKDVVANNSAIIIDYIYSALEGGKIVKYAQGWDANGNELTLNLGTSPANLMNPEADMQGTVWEYATATKNDADYELIAAKETWTEKSIVYQPTTPSNVAYGQYNATVAPDHEKLPFDSSVKFIFITQEDGEGTDVTGITVKTGVSEVKDPANLTYILNKDCNKIIAVVVPNDDDAGNTTNLLYLEKITRYSNNANGKRVAFGTVWINGEKSENVELSKAYDDEADIDKFYTYSESNGVYTLSPYTKTDKATSVATRQVLDNAKLNGLTASWFQGTTNQLNGVDATVIDLYSDDNLEIISVKGMKDAIKNGEINDKTDAAVQNFRVSYIYNGDSNSVGYNTVQYIFITMTDAKGGSVLPPVGDDEYTVNYTVDGVEGSENVKTGTDWTKTFEKDIASATVDGKTDGITVTGKTITVTEAVAKSGTVVIELKSEADTFSLTLSSDAIIGTGHSVIYSIDGGKNWVKAPDPEKKLSPDGDVLIYSIPENAEVAVNTKTAVAVNGSYNVDGVVAVGKTSPAQLTFTMSKDVTINTLPTAKLIALHEGTGVELLKVTKNDGSTEIEVTEIGGVKYISATDAQKLTVKSANADAVIAVTNKTDIKVASSGAKATGTKATNGSTLDYGASIGTDLWLYEASAVAFTDTGVTAKVDGTSLTTGDYVVTGKTVVAAVATPATNGTGVISQTASKNNAVGADEKAGILVGNEDITLKAAFQVTLNEGVTATVGSETVNTGDYVVNGTSTLSLSAEDSGNKVVVDTTDGNTWGAEVSGSQMVSADVTYSAMTKVVLNVEASATISIGTKDELGTPSTTVICTQSGSSAETYGFAENSVILVSGATAQVKDITCTSTDAVQGTKHTGSAGAGDVPTLIVTIKSASVTLGLS